MTEKDDLVLLGEIGAAQGLKGEVRISSYTADQAAITSYGALEDEDGRLYCRVRRGAFRARFGRLALQQLGAYMGEREGGLHLHLAGASYPIRSSLRG